MVRPSVVLDTNVIVAALRSRNGASHRLLSLIDARRFDTSISVPLILEYEAAASELIGTTRLKSADIRAVIDYVCSVANHQKVHFLWRPQLKDPKDDMVLELAVAAGSDYIVTHNLRDFEGSARLGVTPVAPRDFLIRIGELP